MTTRHRTAAAMVLGVVLVGCTPTTAAAPTPGAAATTSTSSSGGLVAEDPDHDTVQPFPARGTCHARTVPGGVLPDPACTPGTVDPAVTPATLDTTICRPGGYSSSVRPPESVTSVEKRAAITAYGATGPVGSFELDHLVPIGIGGSPNSARNLWPEPGASPNPKDDLEAALHDQVCARRLDLAAAQQLAAGDWVTAYRQVLGHDPG